MSSTVKRKLTTILAADAVGYSRAMDTDEISTLSALRAARSVFSKFIERHEGRIVNTAGDGLIAEFPSVVEAVQCAVEVQQELDNHQDTLRFRIGIHLGDVIIDGSDLLGEGVNLAARLESMADPGGVLISRQVYDQVHHKLSIGFEYLGEKQPKNFVENVSVYRLSLYDEPRQTIPNFSKEKPTQKSERENFQPVGLRERIIRNGKLLGVIWLFLIAIDLFTGTPFWAHWPGLGMGTFLAIQATPLFVSGWFKLSHARIIVIICALVLINLFTWTGYPWVMWPTAVLLVIELLRRIRIRD